MQISVDDLVNNPDKYLDMLTNGDIFIARNGEQVARLTQIKPPKEKLATKLFGILPKDSDLAQARDERLKGI